MGIVVAIILIMANILSTYNAAISASTLQSQITRITTIPEFCSRSLNTSKMQLEIKNYRTTEYRSSKMLQRLRRTILKLSPSSFRKGNSTSVFCKLFRNFIHDARRIDIADRASNNRYTNGRRLRRILRYLRTNGRLLSQILIPAQEQRDTPRLKHTLESSWIAKGDGIPLNTYESHRATNRMTSKVVTNGKGINSDGNDRAEELRTDIDGSSSIEIRKIRKRSAPCCHTENTTDTDDETLNAGHSKTVGSGKEVILVATITGVMVLSVIIILLVLVMWRKHGVNYNMEEVALAGLSRQ